MQAGQVLYEIDAAQYRAALGVAQGNLQRAQANIDATRLQAQRYDALAKIDAVSKQEADNARASARVAQADVVAQRSAVDAAQVNMEFTRIRAPISGRISRSVITPGALVQAGQPQPLATIMRTNSVYVDINQSAAQLLNLRASLAEDNIQRDPNGAARVELQLPNGAKYPIEGFLQFSEVSADPNTGSVTLRATFANPENMLLPGMFVRAKLVEGVQERGILAPQQGISRDPRGRATAMVVNAKNEVEARPVTLGRAIGDKWLVTSGLKAGDKLIVEGLLGLRPGAKVKPGAPRQVTAPPAAAAAKAPAKPAPAKEGE